MAIGAVREVSNVDPGTRPVSGSSFAVFAASSPLSPVTFGIDLQPFFYSFRLNKFPKPWFRTPQGPKLSYNEISGIPWNPSAEHQDPGSLKIAANSIPWFQNETAKVVYIFFCGYFLLGFTQLVHRMCVVTKCFQNGSFGSFRESPLKVVVLFGMVPPSPPGFRDPLPLGDHLVLVWLIYELHTLCKQSK